MSESKTPAKPKEKSEPPPKRNFTRVRDERLGIMTKCTPIVINGKTRFMRADGRVIK